MKLTIVIPSYWGRSSRESWNPDDTVYDHPTPVDSSGTLARALESIKKLGPGEFKVVVLGAATHRELESIVESKIETIIAPFRKEFPLCLICHSDERYFHSFLKEEGKSSFMEFLSLTGYSNIRNACLISAVLTDAEAVVLFDDDQVYDDPHYLHKVEEHIGGEYRGCFIGGIAGYYINADGGHRAKEPEDWIWAFWPQAREMNKAFDMMEGGDRLKVTPWVFGGNMVIHRTLFEKIPFDPHVPRGEDIDYLINSKFLGYDFYIDNQLSILHLAPPKSAPPWRRFREDIIRFIYTREKLRSHADAPPETKKRALPIEALDPYPGRFLRDDLDELIFKSCTLMGMDYLSKGDSSGFKESMENIRLVHSRAAFPRNPYTWYLSFQSRWESFMKWLPTCRSIKEYEKLRNLS